MQLYTTDKLIKILNFEELLCIGYRGTANIYKIGDSIYKKYFAYTSDKYKLDNDVFVVLEQFASENMIKILDPLYEDDDLLQISGYIAKYYTKEKINIFDKEVDYTLENMNHIEKLFDELTENKIKVNDVKYENTILTKDKIILIDPDAYKIVNYEKERLKIANKKELMKLFKSIYLHFVKNGSDCKNIYDLFDIKVNEKTNVTYEISKRLAKKDHKVFYNVE